MRSLLGLLLFVWVQASSLQEKAALTADSKKSPVSKGLICHLDASKDQFSGRKWKDRSGKNNYAWVRHRGFNVHTRSFNGKTYTGAHVWPWRGYRLNRFTIRKPYTIFVVDEYHRHHWHGRIVQSLHRNWLLGKWANRNAHYANGWVAWSFKHRPQYGGSPVISVGTLHSNRRAQYYLNGEKLGDRRPRWGPIRLGIGFGGRYWWEWTNGYLNQLLVYNRVLTDKERVKVEWWLSRKFGMKVRHLGLCAKNNGGCDSRTSCTDKEHTRKCGKCPKGFTGSGEKGCKDINECKSNNGGCDARTTCTNKPGTFECGKCPKGFSGSGRAGCSDINECLENNGGCDKLTSCINIEGSSKCGPCKTGFTGTGKTGCNDINECEKKNGGCDAAVKCENVDGSFTCGDCPAGYTGSGYKGCKDIDECSHANGGCHRLTKCSNTPGSRTCGACPAGYEGDGIKGCKDINECAKMNGGCDQQTKCINLRGSKKCGPCPPGYTGSGEKGCEDINECDKRNGGCDTLTKCTNTPGGRKCGACPAGYEGSGYIGCEKEYEGSKTESTKDMTARIAEEAAKKKMEDLEAKHAEWLKNKILDEEAEEKKVRLKRLQDETKKLEELTAMEKAKKEEDDKKEESIKKQAEKTAALEQDRKMMEEAQAAALKIHDDLANKYGKTLTGASNAAPVQDNANAA